MGLIRAIGYNLANLINFKGRATRSQFWPYAVFVFILFWMIGAAMMVPEIFASIERMQRFAAEHPDQATVTQGPGSYSITIHGYHPELMPDLNRIIALSLMGLFAVVFLLAAAVARRLHDRGKSAFWGLMPIPFVIFASVAMPTLFDQFTGDTPNLGLFLGLFLNNVLYIASLIYLIVLLSGASAQGENRFGAERAA